MCISATMLADVVYEPLIVSEGFNKDAIAENTPAGNYADSYLKNSISTYYFFATKSVIETVNTAYLSSHPTYFTDEELALTISNGWPDDYRDTIKCVLDAKDDPLYENVIFLLAPYSQNNVLTLRPDDAIGGTGTLKFKKVGTYTRLMFLTVSAKEGTPDEARRVEVDVHYTEGDPTHAVFNLADGLGGQDGHKVCTTNILESGGYFNKNVSSKYAAGKGKACASVFDIEVDKTRLISHIVCTNPVDKSAAIILAVTGMTADMEIPDAEAATVSNIEKTSFQACWDAIEEAASYRIDVATDIDFQHILEDYNNLPVSGSTCQDIVDLVSNTDYYWRVRSVNSDGGQSASSAPHRVKTAPDKDKGDTPPYTDEEYTNIEENLAPYIGTKSILAELDIHRTLYRDGDFNTLCLPFDLNAEQIAASPLVGAQVYEFVHAEKASNGQLDIEISGPIDHINAGVPYLVKWAPTTPEIIDGGILVFKNVNVVTNHGQTLGGEGEVKFVGNIGIATLVEEEQLGTDHNKLFLGAANTLYWPIENTHLKGFRAYFLVPTTGPNAAPKHTPARIVMRQDTATDVENVQSDKEQCIKVLRDGQLYLMYKGTMYNVQGEKVGKLKTLHSNH